MELNVDGRQYAIDHTLIDSYENRFFDDVRLSRVLEPVIRELNAARALPMEGTFAFLVEARALTAVRTGTYRLCSGMFDHGLWERRPRCAHRQIRHSRRSTTALESGEVVQGQGRSSAARDGC